MRDHLPKLIVLGAIFLGLITIFVIYKNLQKVESQEIEIESAFVNYDQYEELVAEVKEHRKERLVDLDKFLEMSKEEEVIVLDTRSEKMFNSRHLKGAVNLNFSDFNVTSLEALIPSKDTKILIYCNNNFSDDQVNFISKISRPVRLGASEVEIMLALNVPTYINLYGYGYRNIYELSELVSVSDSRLEFEGTFSDQ